MESMSDQKRSLSLEGGALSSCAMRKVCMAMTCDWNSRHMGEADS